MVEEKPKCYEKNIEFRDKKLMASSNFTGGAAPVFSIENYPIWSVKMNAYLRAFDL